MPPYHYYNTLGNIAETATPINLCNTKGPMSLCTAATTKDQHGCTYRVDASHADCCMYYRDAFGGACDSPWAQRGIDQPIKE